MLSVSVSVPTWRSRERCADSLCVLAGRVTVAVSVPEVATHYFSAHQASFHAPHKMPTPAVPTPEEVTVYLAAHSLEATIEEAVNDAVLKQVDSPYRHIAELLLKKSEEMAEPANRSNDAARRASFAPGASRPVHVVAADACR